MVIYVNVGSLLDDEMIPRLLRRLMHQPLRGLPVAPACHCQRRSSLAKVGCMDPFPSYHPAYFFALEKSHRILHEIAHNFTAAGRGNRTTALVTYQSPNIPPSLKQSCMRDHLFRTCSSYRAQGARDIHGHRNALHGHCQPRI